MKKVSVARAISCYDMLPIFMCKLGNKVRWYEKLLISGSLLIAVKLNLDLFLNRFQDISSFLIFLATIIMTFVATCCLWNMFSGKSDRFCFLHDLRKLDDKMELNECQLQEGWRIFLLILMQAVGIGCSIACCICLHGNSFLEAGVFLNRHYTWIILFSFTTQLSISKCLLTSRMKLARMRIASEDLSEVIPNIRSLMDSNGELNKFHSTIATPCIVLFLTKVTSYTADLWLVFGLKSGIRHYSSNNALWMFIFNFMEVSKFLWMTKLSAAASETLEDIKFEFSRLATGSDNLSYRLKVLGFLQELEHFPQEFRCQDLFIADCDGITSACVILLSAMMVFVQFMTA